MVNLTKQKRNIHLLDLSQSDAYKLGLIPLLQELHYDTLRRLDVNGDSKPDTNDFIESAIEEKFIIKIQQRVKAYSKMARSTDDMASRIDWFTSSAKSMALRLAQLKEILDIACRKIGLKGK